MTDDTPTSFDSFAHEHNLTGRWRDLARMAFKLGVLVGRKQAIALQPPSPPVGRRAGEQPISVYNHVTDRDTAPGEFR